MLLLFRHSRTDYDKKSIHSYIDCVTSLQYEAILYDLPPFPPLTGDDVRQEILPNTKSLLQNSYLIASFSMSDSPKLPPRKHIPFLI